MKASGPHVQGSDKRLEHFWRRYQLGSSTVVLSSSEDISAIEQLLCQHIRLSDTSDQRPQLLDTDLLFEFVSPDDELQAPETLGEITATEDLQGKKTASGYYWWCGDSSLQVFLEDARVVGQIKPDFEAYSLYLRRQFFLMAFYMVLRKKHQYCLHANGVIYQEKPCLIAGSSGSGKSTLSLTLALQGWQFWGDDTIALRESEKQKITGLGLRRGSACSLKTASTNPQMQAMYDSAPALQDNKRLLNIESLSAITLVSEADPEIIIFPTIGDHKKSTITPINATLTMGNLIALSAGILTDRDEVQLQMSLLEKLTRQVEAYTMVQGADAIDDPARIADLLAAAITKR